MLSTYGDTSNASHATVSPVTMPSSPSVIWAACLVIWYIRLYVLSNAVWKRVFALSIAAKHTSRVSAVSKCRCSSHCTLSAGRGRCKQRAVTVSSSVPRASPSVSLHAHATTGYSMLRTVPTCMTPSSVSGSSRHMCRSACPHALSEPTICAKP